MEKAFKEILSEDRWLIKEDGFDQSKQNAYETIFTLGNGYMGSRGVLEEIPAGAVPGTYIAGVFDKSIAQVSELVNVPNPVDLRIIAEGEKVDITGMYLVRHQRILDMRQGIIARHTVLANSRKEKFDYKSLRFISQHDRHVGVMRIQIRPLDAPILFTIQDNINVSVRNRGVLTEGKKKHFQISEVRNEKGINYICAKTQDSRISISCATNLKVQHGTSDYTATEQSFDIKLKKGETLTLTKVFYLRTSRHLSLRLLRDTTIKALKKNLRRGFDNLLKQHTNCFTDLWKTADITIVGDKDTEKSLRFNIYHMLICGNPDDPDVSIGARTLSGEGYRGHVFWDTEIFLLPFYIYNFPAIARNLLTYRYNRLGPAREIAKEKGFKGVLFPWESEDSGRDETPLWHKNLDGSIIQITTQDYEHHIVCDIAYAINHYYTATGDQKFINSCGAEIIFEAARFWASRVRENKRRKRFDILHVMGPDEFHTDVNNNAYTNVMAKWNLNVAYGLYYLMKKDYTKAASSLTRRIKLKETEVKRWRHIASRIFVSISRQKKVIEEFDGYFKLKHIPITKWDQHFMPLFPQKLSLKQIHKTQLVKQLDACMLLYLFPGLYDVETRKNTVDFYEKRTVHKSSLSPAINAIMHLEGGSTTRAYQYFLYALNLDLRINQSNVLDGMHAGALGGCWQAVINGFGGMRIRGGYLSFTPRLPGHWKELEFYVKWREYILRLKVTQRFLTMRVKAVRGSKSLKVEIYHQLYEVSPGESITVYNGGSQDEKG